MCVDGEGIGQRTCVCGGGVEGLEGGGMRQRARRPRGRPGGPCARGGGDWEGAEKGVRRVTARAQSSAGAAWLLSLQGTLHERSLQTGTPTPQLHGHGFCSHMLAEGLLAGCRCLHRHGVCAYGRKHVFRNGLLGCGDASTYGCDHVFGDGLARRREYVHMVKTMTMCSGDGLRSLSRRCRLEGWRGVDLGVVLVVGIWTESDGGEGRCRQV
eukprot:351587-Chlamydomonas_euryale.AAC.2